MATTVLDRFVTEYVFRGNTAALDRIQRRINSVRASIDRASSVMMGSGTAMTTAFVGAGAVIYKFQTEINALHAATNASAKDMEIMREQAKELGKTTQFSASQAAEAQKLLGQAGFDTQKIIGAMPAVLNLAAAGALEIGNAADVATSMMAGFGLESNELQRAVDVLALTASSAKTTVADMGVAMRLAAPLAAKLGISVESTSAATAMLQNAGLEPGQSGTLFNNVLTRLIKITSRAKIGFDEMGVSWKETQDLAEQGEWVTIFEMFEEAGMTARQASMIFGAYSAKGALILADQLDNVKDLTATLEGAEGSAARMAEQQMAGLPGAIKTLVSRIEGLILVLGDAGLTGSIIAMSEWLIQAIDWFTALSPAIQSAVAYTIAAGPFMLALGFGLKVVGFALAGLLPLLAFAKWGVGLLAIAFRGLTAAFMANPIGFLIGSIVLLIYYWDEIVAAIQWGGGLIKEALEAIGVPVDDIFAWIGEQWDATTEWLKGPAEGESIIAWLWRPYSNIFGWIVDYWVNLWAQLWGLIPDWIKKFFGLSETPTVEFGGMDIDQGNTDRTYEAAGLDFDVRRDTTAADADALGLGGIIGDPIKHEWSEAMNWIEDKWDELWAWLSSPIDGMFDWVSRAWDNMLLKMYDLIPDWLKDLLGIEGAIAVEGVDRTGGTDLFSLSRDYEQMRTAARDLNAPQSFDYSRTNQANSSTVNLNIGDINVNAQNGDSAEIAQNVRTELRDQLQSAVEDYDSVVLY